MSLDTRQLTPRSIPEADILGVKKNIYAAMGEGSGARDAFDYWHLFFSGRGFSPEDAKMYYSTYWTWYVNVSWRVIDTLPPEVAKDVFLYQFPYATGVEYVSILQKYAWYLLEKFPEADAMRKFHEDLKKSLLVSDFPLNAVTRKPEYTVQKLIAFAKSRSEKDSLSVSEYAAGLERELFGASGGDEKITAMKRELIQSLYGFVELFTADVDPVQYVNAYYALLRESSELPLETEVEAEALYNKTMRKLVPLDLDELKIAEEENVEQVDSSMMSYSQIKTMITSRFSQDENGQFANIEGVLALLDSLATEYSDEKIRELYYFDESAGGFRWNEELA